MISGKLVLGFGSGLHLNFLAPVIEAFRKAHPSIEFDYFHGTGREQLKSLRAGRLDLAFVMSPEQTDGLEQRVLWRVPYKVVLPVSHPLARRKEFHLSDLRGEAFVFCTRESRPEFYDQFFRHCANAGFRPRVIKEVGGYPTNMLGLISVGAGISVLPHFEGIERITGLVWRPMIQPKLWVDSSLIWRQEPGSRAVEEFISTAQAILRPVPTTDTVQSI